MKMAALTLALAAWLPLRQGPERPLLEGIVVNGTRSDAPVARTEVVLRAGKDNALQHVATTFTDAGGRFAVRDLPLDSSLVYLAGANHCGIHYPGPRMQLEPGRLSVPVRLTVYDTVTAPSPLVAEKHEIEIHVQPAALEITESLWVKNPSLTTFVGAPDQDGFAETLRLAIPSSFERVTFHQEFFGRRFKLGDKCVVTDIPWTPGKREVKFTYEIPRTGTGPNFERFLDLPCADVRLRVVGDDAKRVNCNLPRVEGRSDAVFASTGELLAQGAPVRLHLGVAALPWTTSARWIGLSTLAALILATLTFPRLRKVLQRSSGCGHHDPLSQHAVARSK